MAALKFQSHFILCYWNQTYYGIYPVPMADGTAVKLTLEQSFKGGFIHHFFDYFIAFLIVNHWRGK